MNKLIGGKKSTLAFRKCDNLLNSCLSFLDVSLSGNGILEIIRSYANCRVGGAEIIHLVFAYFIYLYMSDLCIFSSAICCLTDTI